MISPVSSFRPSVAPARATEAPEPQAPARKLKPSLQEYLTLPGVGGPAWSPDGKSLAYLSNASGQTQIHLRGADGADRQITSGNQGVKWVTWTEDGSHLLYGADTDGDERTQIHLVRPDGAGHRNLTARPGVIHDFGGFTPDGKGILYASNARDKANFDLYVQDLAGGEPRMIHRGEGMLSPAGFSPDGTKVLFSRATSNLNNDLFVLDLTTGRTRHLTPHEGDARFYGPKFSEDGKSLLLNTDRNGEYLALSRMDLATGAVTPVAGQGWDVEGWTMSPDQGTVAFTQNEDGYSKLYLHDLATGMTRPGPALPEGVVTDLEYRDDGSLAFKASGPVRTSSLWTLDPASGRSDLVLEADLGAVDPAGLVKPELVRYPSFDGREIPAFLYRPPDAPKDRPLPAVIVVHGGPESQTRPNFTALHQYFVDRGLAVLAPNIRGSVGYGKTFSHLDDVDKRPDAIADVKAAKKWLQTVGIDSSRVAVMGGSYGGWMTLACLAFEPEEWAAGVDVVGMSNLETFLENTGPWRVKLRAAEYGDPVRDKDLLRRMSPIHKVDDIRAPLMIIQGANDPRVPKSEADQMAAAMKARGAEVEYLLFEDEGHGLAKLPNKVKGYEAVAEFLEKHLKPA